MFLPFCCSLLPRLWCCTMCLLHHVGVLPWIPWRCSRELALNHVVPVCLLLHQAALGFIRLFSCSFGVLPVCHSTAVVLRVSGVLPLGFFWFFLPGGALCPDPPCCSNLSRFYRIVVVMFGLSVGFQLWWFGWWPVAALLLKWSGFPPSCCDSSSEHYHVAPRMGTCACCRHDT